MKKIKGISDLTIGIRGGGDLASGVAWRLFQCGFRIFITEIEAPLAVRRKVAFCEAVYDGRTIVEGVEAQLVEKVDQIVKIWEQGKIPVLVDPDCKARAELMPDVLIDAILAKKNLGTSIDHAPLVMALGPGFEAGRDAHYVIETNRGHNLGRLLNEGMAEQNTGVPGSVKGISEDRVLRAPTEGVWETGADIGHRVKKGDQVGLVNGDPAYALIDGVLRGIIRPGIHVTQGLKIGDIDPRGIKENCFTISDKALAIAGGVLEGILRVYAGS